MNSRTPKYTLTGLGTVTLIAAAFSFGGDADQLPAPASDQVRSEHAASSWDVPAARWFRTSTASGAERAATSGVAAILPASHRPGATGFVVLPEPSSPGPAVAPTPERSEPTSGSSDDDNSQAIVVTIPHRVTIVPPRYEGGSAPSATPPYSEGGSDPTITQDGRKIVVDPGESGTWHYPEVDPGQPGTVTGPDVDVEW